MSILGYLKAFVKILKQKTAKMAIFHISEAGRPA